MNTVLDNIDSVLDTIGKAVTELSFTARAEISVKNKAKMKLIKSIEDLDTARHEAVGALRMVRKEEEE